MQGLKGRGADARIRSFVATLAAAVLCTLSANPAVAQTGKMITGNCGGSDPITYVCGLRNIEDLQKVPGQSLLVVATYGMKAGPDSLLLLDANTHGVRLFPFTIPAKPEAPYQACPAPFDIGLFSPHGIALKAGADGRHTLYVVNHGGRESIEVFAMDARTADIRARWIGCVVLPEGASGNAVAPLDDGGFVATKFFDTREGPQLPQFAARKRTSLLYRWSPTAGFSVIPGGDRIGDNGVIVSPDGTSVYVTSWIEKKIFRLPLKGDQPITSVAVDLMPDNLRWAPDGSILIGGQATDIDMLVACKHARCDQDWSVARMDPKTLKVDYLYWEKGTPTFAGATVAEQVGQKLFIGTFHGDRIVVADVPAKPLP